MTENQGFAAGITMLVILVNYFSVSLTEHLSATATGSLIILLLLELLFGFLICHLTKKDSLGFGISIVLMLVTSIVFFYDASLFDGLMPKILSSLSLFDRFNAFVNGVFDLTAIIYYLSVIVFFLFLSVQSLEKRRYN